MANMDMLKDEEVAILAELNAEEKCIMCGDPVVTMTYRGTGVCGGRCARADGRHRSSVGTYMFVTTEEKANIVETRNG